MQITAKDFSSRPQCAYHTAEKGDDEVIINHDRYPGVVFVLSARARRTQTEDTSGACLRCPAHWDEGGYETNK